MAKVTFFGFALADSMFVGDCKIDRMALTPEEAVEMIGQGVVPCLNPSHEATIQAMTSRFGIEVEIPATPPQVKLATGDTLLVMGVRGLPRLTDRHEYNTEEIAGATFSFSTYTVVG
jgi:hypothetical protein